MPAPEGTLSFEAVKKEYWHVGTQGMLPNDADGVLGMLSGDADGVLGMLPGDADGVLRYREATPLYQLYLGIADGVDLYLGIADGMDKSSAMPR